VLTQNIGTLTITQPVQTITFGPLSPVTYCSVPLTLNAAATSGLKVSYRIVSGPATVSGSNVTYTGAGVVVIEADQSGNATFPAAVPVQQSLIVNRAPLTVTPGPAWRAYGAANPDLVGSLVGAVPADSLTATYSSTANAASPVGSYPITATLNDPFNEAANYNVSVMNGTLTVTKATLSVTADNATRPYGLPNPTLTGKISGAFGGDAITASYSSSATGASSPGAYPIAVQASGADPANYNVTTTPGTLTVTPASVTVSIQLSTQTAAIGSSTTLTAKVASTTTGVPTGTITFFDGQTNLGALHSDGQGQATLSSAGFVVGAHTLTAAYSGDANFNAATSPSATLAVGTPDFAITSDSPTLTISAGQSGAVRLSVTPAFGFNQPLTLSCGTLPKYMSCQFNPSSLTPDGTQAMPVQLTVSVAATTSQLSGSSGALLAAIVPLGLLGLIPLSDGRRRWRGLRGLILLSTCISGAVLGCGGAASSAPSVVPPPSTTPSGIQTVTVTVTSAGYSHELPLNIVIKGS
jgi:Bacterial Ig-like domain (group 3)/MBG domain (YGX type)